MKVSMCFGRVLPGVTYALVCHFISAVLLRTKLSVHHRIGFFPSDEVQHEEHIALLLCPSSPLLSAPRGLCQINSDIPGSAARRNSSLSRRQRESVYHHAAITEPNFLSLPEEHRARERTEKGDV